MALRAAVRGGVDEACVFSADARAPTLREGVLDLAVKTTYVLAPRVEGPAAPSPAFATLPIEAERVEAQRE